MTSLQAQGKLSVLNKAREYNKLSKDVVGEDSRKYGAGVA
jgi:hypothetical protein